MQMDHLDVFPFMSYASGITNGFSIGREGFECLTNNFQDTILFSKDNPKAIESPKYFSSSVGEVFQPKNKS